MPRTSKTALNWDEISRPRTLEESDLFVEGKVRALTACIERLVAHREFHEALYPARDLLRALEEHLPEWLGRPD